MSLARVGLSDEFHRVGDLALVIQLHLHVAVAPEPEIGNVGGKLARIGTLTAGAPCPVNPGPFNPEPRHR